ncbi:hypothetical protein EIP86_009459 [Pleurotus ostreatoroseus]|nr:hypothetical protein EIP86_009459 [Pleurotus ostreatoroseus]
MAKGRWIGRELLEIVSTEFRDRSMEYYRYALESGVTTVNGKIAKPDTIIRNGDRIENVVHRHEPPITSTPIQIILEDKEREFIVINKPGSIPVHPSGRYFKHSLTELLKNEFGYPKICTVNRLDRLTSGLMIIPTSGARANELSKEFMAGNIQKEYVARCKGEFPPGEVICEEPLITIDRQVGLNIVHPKGKPAKTVFRRLHYDAKTNSSVVSCKPITGRSHQIRVHLQFLGHPIANDSIYSEVRIWGEDLGKGGIDITPSEEREAPAAPPIFQFSPETNPENVSAKPSLLADSEAASQVPERKLLPRETGHDIGMGSPVPLSSQAVSVITKLRNMKDEDEDWSRWRDVVFRTKGALHPDHITIPPPPPQNRRRRGGPIEIITAGNGSSPESDPTPIGTPPVDDSVPKVPPPDATFADWAPEAYATLQPEIDETSQTSSNEAVEKATTYHAATANEAMLQGNHPGTDNPRYCPDCYLPLHPDPSPEKLYIFLHALRYTTSLGTFETEMPAWADPDFEWDRS